MLGGKRLLDDDGADGSSVFVVFLYGLDRLEVPTAEAELEEPSRTGTVPHYDAS